MLQQEELLRPGLYLRSGETVWRRWSVTLPDHLRLSKAQRETSATAGPRTSRARERVGAAIQSILPPVAFWVTRQGTGTYPIAVAAHDDGVVVLHPDEGKVARVHASRPLDAEYTALRTRLSRHLSTPSFEVSPDGRLLTEEFVPGHHFAELGEADQLRVMRRILRSYASLTEHEGEGDCHAAVADAVRAVREGTPPAGVGDLLSGFDLTRRSAPWPLVPSATDASVKNLIITGDGRPVAIDLGNLRLDPFFSYPLGVVTMARGVVLEQFVAGGLDEELSVLLGPAAPDFPLHGAGREALLALRLALVSRRAATTTGTFEQAVFDDSLARRWSALWSGRPPAFG